MGTPFAEPTFDQVLDQILGYLNFSSGSHDPKLFINLNLVFEKLSLVESEKSTLRRIRDSLMERLDFLASEKSSFEKCEQARETLQLTFDHLLDDYRSFHSDVLFHQKNEAIFNAFFIGRVFEVVLSTRETATELTTDKVIGKLNDYVGHRPVATLETHKAEPYPNEWVCPVPLYLKDAGTAFGPYREIVDIAIKIISETDVGILRSAQFDLGRLKELAFDPRAFDFDHPINRRPNHHFGLWDENSLDDDGYFERFILHEITLSSMLCRVDENPELPKDELIFEAGAVLAGTILMASAISGAGPGAYDSETSLGDLLPVIAGFRDQFYQDLITRIPEAHRERLMAEASLRRQPFGGARQDLNNELGSRRSRQLVNCRLASLYAQMGYSQQALDQSAVVPIASARINCQLDCLLATAVASIKAGDLDKAFEQIPSAFEQLKRAIACGAIVDPWNILGFDANYSLFPAVENSVRDHRVDDLVELLHQIFSVCSRLWADAAAMHNVELSEKIRVQFHEIVEWWRQFAAHEVMSVDTTDPQDDYDAAELVARALNLWHQGGAAAGDIGFWANHAKMFDSSSAYDLVIDALLQREDFKTSMALLVHWLSQADRIPLQQGECSFHDLMFRWISAQKNLIADANAVQKEEMWNRIRKFYDFMEANAGYYWEVPRFRVGEKRRLADPQDTDVEEDEDSTDELLTAAYENMTYVDQTDDGFEGAVFDTSLTSDDELEAEVDRVMDRLEFLGSVAEYWRIAATVALPVCNNHTMSEEVRIQLDRRRKIYSGWMDQVVRNREQLVELLQSVHSYRLPASGADQDSLMEYDRHRLYKESLMQRIIDSCVQSENAARMLGAVVAAIDHLSEDRPLDEVQTQVQHQQPLVSVFSAVILRDQAKIIDLFPALCEYLSQHSLLYIPLGKNGDPHEIVKFRTIRGAIVDLLRCLPAIGLLVETHELLETSLSMERNQQPGAGSITEFDGLFKVGFCAMVRSLSRSTEKMNEEGCKNFDDPLARKEVKKETDKILFDCVQIMTESMLIMWLEHSKTLRLSVLEKVNDDESWSRLVEFIQRYGAEIFTQPFLRLSNVRAILHQGVDTWLDQLQRSPTHFEIRLLEELDHELQRSKAIRYLTLILEAVIDNYGEYRDYNASTTQSDRGEMLYVLMDFLRLSRRYDRVCWHLNPVVWAHEILVRKQINSVARMWRRSLVERVDTEAQKYLNELDELRRKYSIQLDSVGRHLEGRFVQPMQIDRLRAQVEPAMRDTSDRKSQRAFDLLVSEIEAFTRHPNAGVDVPDWLAALEEEVHIQLMPDRLKEDFRKQTLVEPLDHPIEKLREQLDALPKRKPEF